MADSLREGGARGKRAGRMLTEANLVESRTLSVVGVWRGKRPFLLDAEHLQRDEEQGLLTSQRLRCALLLH